MAYIMAQACFHFMAPSTRLGTQQVFSSYIFIRPFFFLMEIIGWTQDRPVNEQIILIKIKNVVHSTQAILVSL